MDAPIVEPVAPAEPAAPVAPSDPFSIDENKFASLSPEQRAALDPVLDEFRTKAKAEIEKTGKTYEEKYKPHQEKAQALDELVRDPRFQTWWKSTQAAYSQVNPAGAPAVNQAKPQDFATNEEWQQAVWDLNNNDPTKFKEIQARMFSVMATPVIQELKQGQEELRTTLEMKNLFETHADAKELDLIGRNPTDPNDKSQSLLEFALEWADNNRRPLEEGYQMARKWADSLKVGAKKEAMGLVQEKKASVTSGPSTNQGGGTSVVEVADADELMAKNMEYLASGQKPPKFVIRNQSKQPAWSQRN